MKWHINWVLSQDQTPDTLGYICRFLVRTLSSFTEWPDEVMILGYFINLIKDVHVMLLGCNRLNTFSDDMVRESELALREIFPPVNVLHCSN